jgi:hypothetical protein
MLSQTGDDQPSFGHGGVLVLWLQPTHGTEATGAFGDLLLRLTTERAHSCGEVGRPQPALVAGENERSNVTKHLSVFATVHDNVIEAEGMGE